MNEPTHLSKAIDVIAPSKLAYDKNVKKLLSDIQILARIVKYTVEDVKNLSIEEIIQCIDASSIETGKVGVDPGYTNTNFGIVESTQVENAVPNEGYITYDIRFYLAHNEKQLKIIINVEAQKSSDVMKLHYHIENRIQFYMARLISAQKETEFIKSNYDDIKKIYSIWICTDASDDEVSISEIGTYAKPVFGKCPYLPELNKMNAVLVKIRSKENIDESKHILIAMLEDLLRNEEKELKKRKLSEKYEFKMTQELKRSVDDMCNLSDVLEEKVNEKNIRKLVSILRTANQSDDFIINALKENYELSEEEAKEYL